MPSPSETLQKLEDDIKSCEKLIGSTAVHHLLSKTGELYIQVFGTQVTGNYQSAEVSLHLIQREFQENRTQASMNKAVA